MTHLIFDESDCRNTRVRLDSSSDDEPPVETNLEMAGHFQACGACEKEAAERRELRGRLRTAARAVPAPAGPDERVRAPFSGRKDGRKRRGR